MKTFTVFAVKNGRAHDKDRDGDACFKGMVRQRKSVVEFTGASLQIAAQKADDAGYKPCRKCLKGILGDVIEGHSEYAGRLDEEAVS